MTKIAALAVAFAVAFAPVAYAAETAADMSGEAPKTKKECKKMKDMKWDEKTKTCVAKTKKK
jgi:hypothetical protein